MLRVTFSQSWLLAVPFVLAMTACGSDSTTTEQTPTTKDGGEGRVAMPGPAVRPQAPEAGGARAPAWVAEPKPAAPGSAAATPAEAREPRPGGARGLAAKPLVAPATRE